MINPFERVMEREDIALHDGRIRKCLVCGSQTKQIVEEFTIEHYPWDKHNSRPNKYWESKGFSWYCTECDDFTDTIQLGKY